MSAKAEQEIASLIRLGTSVFEDIEPGVKEIAEKTKATSIRLHPVVLEYFDAELPNDLIIGVLIRYVQVKNENRARYFELFSELGYGGPDSNRRDKFIWGFIENLDKIIVEDRVNKKKIYISWPNSVKDHFKSEYPDGWSSKINNVLRFYATVKMRKKERLKRSFFRHEKIDPDLSSYIYGSEVKIINNLFHSSLKWNISISRYADFILEYFLGSNERNFVCAHCGVRGGGIHLPNSCRFNKESDKNKDDFLQVNCSVCNCQAFKWDEDTLLVHDSSKCRTNIIRGCSQSDYIPVSDSDDFSQLFVANMFRFIAFEMSMSKASDLDEKLVYDTYGKAVEIYHKFAQQGNTWSMAQLEGMYSLGLGVEPDGHEAMRWFRLRNEAPKRVQTIQSSGGFYGTGIASDIAQYESITIKSIAEKAYKEAKKQSAIENRIPSLPYLGGYAKQVMQNINVESEVKMMVCVFEYLFPLISNDNKVAVHIIIRILKSSNERKKYYDKALSLSTSLAIKDKRKLVLSIGRALCDIDIDEDKYKLSLNDIYTTAIEGDALAQCVMGKIFRDGIGVPENSYLAQKWFYLSAQQGFPEAQYSVYPYHSHDKKRMLAWKLLAAEQGHLEAQKNLGLTFFGDGTLYIAQSTKNTDFKNSYKWFYRAAKQGDRSAQFELGRFYANGFGVERDFKKAMIYFRKSADQEPGIAELAYQLIDFLTKNEVGYQHKYLREYVIKYAVGTPSEYIIDFNFFVRAWSKKFPDEMFGLGLLHFVGVLKQDYDEGIKWLSEAALLDHAVAQYEMGLIYLQGVYVDTNYKIAEDYLVSASEQDVLDAHYVLGLMYFQGYEDKTSDPQKAEKYFQLAIASGHEAAKQALEMMKANTLADWIGSQEE